jgi:hypothetical protein
MLALRLAGLEQASLNSAEESLVGELDGVGGRPFCCFRWHWRSQSIWECECCYWRIRRMSLEGFGVMSFISFICNLPTIQKLFFSYNRKYMFHYIKLSHCFNILLETRRDTRHWKAGFDEENGQPSHSTYDKARGQHYSYGGIWREWYEENQTHQI